MSDNFKIGFFKALWIIKDYLPEIVIGGGWTPLLYYHYLLKDKSLNPIMTRDIDLVVGKKIPIIGQKTVDELFVEAGFESKFKSRDIPPVIHYEANIDGHEVEVEFLTDQTGNRENKVIEVQKGLHAEALRYISILIDYTIQLEIDDFPVKPGLKPLIVKAPTPEAYIMHKGLIFTRRKNRQKQSKDLYYIFDILSNCTEIKASIIKGLKSLRETHPSWFEKFLRNLRNSYLTPKPEGVMMVLNQRPSGAFQKLDDAQFKQYVLGTFQEFIEEFHI